MIVDRFEDLQRFSRSNPFTLFFSHQWLGNEYPDPGGEHYRAMCKAAEAVRHRFEVDEAELLLWVDYASIPQANANLQKAAIASLGV